MRIFTILPIPVVTTACEHMLKTPCLCWPPDEHLYNPQAPDLAAAVFQTFDANHFLFHPAYPWT